MNISTGSVVHGFEVTGVRAVEEISAVCYELRHIKTGAELVWMDNGADNKLFSITFKTIPEDSTGVFHILEHSVLCGSENYPVKEPFVELLKSSLNTFLNAMTFPDKTMYPVSSRNKTDFVNLSRVYLDAVFKPAILTNPNIFYQEGWHFELDDAQSEPAYNGVVFNEMKGAYSSVDRTAHEALCRQLFPDNCYGLSSGGDPERIPDLTYEQFLAAYRRYYHPSNARIYLDGSVPFEEILTIIDEEYLCGYEPLERPVELRMQAPVESCESVCEYEIGSQDDPEGKDLMIRGKVICDWSDRVKQLACYALGQYLTGSNDAPLKKAILEAGLGQDVTMAVEDGVAQPFVYLMIRNASHDSRLNIDDVIRNTAERLLEEGLDLESIEASVNHAEFGLRECEEPAGLERAIYAMSSWLYGGDPLLYIVQDEVFRELRERLDESYCAGLLRELLLDTEHTATVWCLPSRTLGEERREKERLRLQAISSGWSEADRADVLALNHSLREWQQTPDTPEDLAALPALRLDEVSSEPEERVTHSRTVNGVTVLTHPSPSRGIVYFSLYFNISDINREDIPAASLAASLLGRLPTSAHTVAQLDREMKAHVGSASFAVHGIGTVGNTSACKLLFTARCSVLEEKFDKAVALITEILTDTRFERLEDIRTLVNQQYDRARRSIIGSGHRYGMYRTLSCFSAEFDAKELTDGYSYYDYIRSLKEDADHQLRSFSDFAGAFAARAFCSGRLTVSVTSGSDDRYAERILSAIPNGSAPAVDEYAPKLSERRREQLEIPAAVSFAAMGANVYALGFADSAELRLITHIVSYHHLWNAIRVQGGAYGAGLTSGDSGNVCFYTYRDPNSSRSLGIFRTVSDFLRSFCADDEALDKSVIGCLSNLDTLESIKDKGISADNDCFRGITHSRRAEIWQGLLHTDKQKLLELAGLLDSIAEKGAVCVIGGADIVAACAGEQLTALTF